jgi:hypothetical protein
VRTVFAFPAGERAATIALLDQHFPQQRHPWVMNEALYIDLDDEQSGSLYSDWEPEAVAALVAVTGQRPDWVLEIDISGRIDGTDEIHQLLALLLEHGGVAFDDYTEHPWTLQEIQSGASVDGLRFFDFRAHHQRHYGPGAEN